MSTTAYRVVLGAILTIAWIAFACLMTTFKAGEPKCEYIGSVIAIGCR